jgi:hypothetical protein
MNPATIQPSTPISLPPEPQEIGVLPCKGSDNLPYVILMLTTDTGPYSVRLPMDRAEKLATAVTESIQIARAGLHIAKTVPNGKTPFGR